MKPPWIRDEVNWLCGRFDRGASYVVFDLWKGDLPFAGADMRWCRCDVEFLAEIKKARVLPSLTDFYVAFVDVTVLALLAPLHQSWICLMSGGLHICFEDPMNVIIKSESLAAELFWKVKANAL